MSLKQRLIRLFIGLSSIFFLWIFISSIIFRSNVYYNQNRFISLLVCLIVLVLWYVIYNKFFNKIKLSLKLEILILIIYFTLLVVVQLIIIKNLSVYPGWDFGVIFNNALEYVQNGTRENATYIEYFQYFPNNIMIFVLFTLIIKIGNVFSMSAMQSMWTSNILFINLSVILLYLVCRRKYNTKAAMYSLFISSCFITLVLYTPIFYSDTFSLFIGILFIYLYSFVEKNSFCKKNVILFTCFGIIAFLGKTIKITSIIVLIALIFEFIFNNKPKYVIYHIPFIIISFLTLNILFTNLVVNNNKYQFNINSYGSYPLTHWVMMGVEDPNVDNSDRNAYGGYSSRDYDLTRNFDTGSNAIKFNIKETIRRIDEYGPFGYFTYLSRKSANAWGDGLYYADVAVNINPINKNTILRNILFNDKKGNLTLIYITQGIQFAFLAILAGGRLLNKQKEKNIDYIRLSIFGLALFLLFWENRSRYLLNFIPLFILCVVDFYYNFQFKRGVLMKKIFNKYKELIMYGIFGVLTTLVNIVCFFVLDHVGVNTYINNTISWIASVLFAFFTNKYFVFESKENSMKILLKEGLSFFGARLLSYFIDMITIYILFEIIGINKMISKIISNVIVIIINYVVSKLFVFKKKGDEIVKD